jgi:outer membrane protein assembly factor BamB
MFPWRDPSRQDFTNAARWLREANSSGWNTELIAESFAALEPWQAGRAAGLLRLSDPEALARGYDDILPRIDPAAVGRRWLRSHWPSHPLVTAVAALEAKNAEPSWEFYWSRNDSWSSFARRGGPAMAWRERWTQRGPALASDDATLPSAWRMIAADEVSLRNPPRKLSAIDAFVWADALRHAVTVSDDAVFAVEPREVAAATPRFAARRQWSWRTRGNELAAYDRQSGELRWRRGAEEFLPPDQDADATFLGPIVSGDHGLFAPLLGGSTLYLVSFAPEDGATRWRCRVAGEPREGAWPWSAAALAAAGRDLYANLGAGLIVAVSQETGALRWLARYPRSVTRRGTRVADGASPRGQPTAGGQSPTEFPTGWDEERLAVVGPHLVSVASDSDALLAMDRRTGAISWESPRDAAGASPASHLLGATESVAVVAGQEVIRGYELATGRLLWEHDAGRVAGRATVLGARDGEAVVAVVCLAESLARVPTWLGAEDPLHGAAPRAELLVLDALTGGMLHRRPMTRGVRLPLDLIPVDESLLLADRAGVFRLSLANEENSSPPVVVPDASVPATKGAAAMVAGWQRLVRVPLKPAVPTAVPASAPAAVPASTPAAVPPASPAAPTAGEWRILLSDLARGVVVECDQAGRERWSYAGIRFPGAVCGWSDTRRWVLDHDRCLFVELNGGGQAVAEWTGLPGRPASLRALPDGAAIATFPDLGVVGMVDSVGQWRWTFRCLGRPVDAMVDGQGRIWVALAGDTRIAAFDTAGRLLHAIELSGRPRTVQVLEAAPSAVALAYLLPDLGQLFRVSISLEPANSADANASVPTGPQLLQTGGKNARFAHSLTDGGCVLADAAGVRCLDPQGRLLWKREGDIIGGVAVLGSREP